VTSRWCHRREL